MTPTQFTDIGGFGGNDSRAIAVNESGQIVGSSNFPGNGPGHAFRYSNGAMQDLGTLGGTSSSASDINASGQIVDSRTGVPLSLLNPVLGLQSGVFLTKQLTATATTSWDRDRVTNYIYHQDNAVLAQSTPGSGVSQETTGTTLTWSHDLNPLTTTNVSLGYARINLGNPTTVNSATSPNSNENLLTVGISVTYLLGPSLTSWASYSFLDRSSPQPLLRAAANVITVGVRKDF